MADAIEERATSDMDSAPQKFEGPTLPSHRQASKGDCATPVQTSVPGSSSQSQVGTLPNSCERVCPLQNGWRALAFADACTHHQTHSRQRLPQAHSDPCFL